MEKTEPHFSQRPRMHHPFFHFTGRNLTQVHGITLFLGRKVAPLAHGTKRSLKGVRKWARSADGLQCEGRRW